MATLDAIHPVTGELERIPVPLQPQLWHAVTGATGIQIVLREEGHVVFHGEVTLTEPAPVSLEFTQRNSEWQVRSDSRAILPFPVNEVTEPIVRVLAPPKAIDVFILVDATMLHPKSDNVSELSYLLGSADWLDWRERILPFVSALQEHGELRVGLGAFGDNPIGPWGRGILLQPKIWHLGNMAITESAWTGLRGVDGGDFVDAVADGLRECKKLPWRSGSRKLILLFGDSPGYSVADAGTPPVDLADAQLRIYDVYEEAFGLHRAGVDLITLYHCSAANALRHVTNSSADLLRFAREQYFRLASLPGWAFTSEDWEPSLAASKWVSVSGVVARSSVPPLAPPE
ncbi:MAG: hypothetical protein JNK87_41730 [Bryobacterales bacterium]|nr:hypothetical protein [Bryobacterales bacterium]